MAVNLVVDGIYALEEAVPRFQSFIWYYMVEGRMSGIDFLLQFLLLGWRSSSDVRRSCATQVEILYIGGFEAAGDSMACAIRVGSSFEAQYQIRIGLSKDSPINHFRWLNYTW